MNAAQPGRAGVSPAKRQALVTSSEEGRTLRSQESRRLACETPGVGNFLRGRVNAAQPGRAGVSPATQRKGVRCAAWSAGVSPAKRQSMVTFLSSFCRTTQPKVTQFAPSHPARRRTLRSPVTAEDVHCAAWQSPKALCFAKSTGVSPATQRKGERSVSLESRRLACETISDCNFFSHFAQTLHNHCNRPKAYVAQPGEQASRLRNASRW